MNVATSSSTNAMANASDIGATKSQTKISKNSSEKSFGEEMKTVSKNEETKESQKNEKNSSKDNKVSENKTNVSSKDDSQKDEKSDDLVSLEVIKGEINFTDYKYHNESQSILSVNIQSLLNTKDLMNIVGSATTIDYDVINMSDSDANFFANLVQNTNMSIQGIAEQISLTQNSQNIKQNIQVSSVLMEKLAESLKTNKPFRIDFDKDVSVIIKVNKDGSLSANFIPGDKAVEQYLRNNIASLRQRFDEENLAYSELTYSSGDKKQQQRNKKENNNE